MRLKLLNGAPLREHLDYSDHVLIAASECGRFEFEKHQGQSTEENTSLKWRDIGLKSAPLRTGWSQPYLPGTANDSQSFVIPGLEESSALPEYDASNLDNTLTFDENLSAADDYLEHSLVLYDTLLSSQVVQDNAADNTVTSSSFLTRDAVCGRPHDASCAALDGLAFSTSSPIARSRACACAPGKTPGRRKPLKP